MSKTNKMHKQAPEQALEDKAEVNKVAPTEQEIGITLEKVESMTAEEVITAFGNKSNAIRGLAALGMKTGPIAKKLAIVYQHARNVLIRPLKRVIKEERDAKKATATAEAEVATGE